MRLVFKFDSSNWYKSTCVFLNDEALSWRDEYVRIYLDTLKFDSSITLADLSIDKDYVSTDVMDAVIDKDKVYLGFSLYLPEDRPADYDPSEEKYYIIDREELTYLVRRWYSFIQRPVELKQPDYQEIIDSEDAYK